MMKVEIIAEIGQAHDGSLGTLHSYIDALSGTGVDVVKFQMHIAEAESSKHEEFRVNFSYEDSTRYEYWKRMEFTIKQWKEIKKHCDDLNLEFMCSPFSMQAVNYLELLDVNRYKIGSGEVTNHLMLEHIAKTKKDIILSSGMSSYDDLDSAINLLKKYDNNVAILQCTTMYPTPASQVGLNVINELTSRYNLPVGLSDHSGTIYPSMAAVALGAKILEFHISFSKRAFGPDSSSSLTIEEVKELVTGVRFIEKSLSTKVVKDDNLKFDELQKLFGKSLSVNKDILKGRIITVDDLESKKPSGKGISAKDYKSVLGKKLNKNLKKWDFLTKEDIDE